MACTKQEQKAIDNRTHNQLHDYLVLLKHLYATTKEFDAVFKPDMFVKNNKAAAQHIIYYLLKILSPSTIKKKIPNWPILDNKMEVHFRKEVMSYINELKTIYPDSEIPTVVASHLINPGGLKFVNLMLDITQLVVTEVLKREDFMKPTMMLNAKHNPHFKDHTNILSTHVKKHTSVIEMKTSQRLREHHQKLHAYKDQAEQISLQHVESKTNVVHLTETLKYLQLQSDDQADIDDADIDKIEEELSGIIKLRDKFNHCLSVLNYFKSNDCFLEYDPSQLAVDQQDIKLSLNLLKHFDKFKKFCSVKIYDIRRVEHAMVDNKLEIIGRILKQYDALLQKCPVIVERQDIFLRDLMGICQGTADFSNTIQDSQQTPQNYFIPKIIVAS